MGTSVEPSEEQATCQQRDMRTAKLDYLNASSRHKSITDEFKQSHPAWYKSTSYPHISYETHTSTNGGPTLPVLTFERVEETQFCRAILTYPCHHCSMSYLERFITGRQHLNT